MLKSFRALLGSVLRSRQIQGYMGYCAVHGTKLRTNARSLGYEFCLQPVCSHFRSRQPLRKKAWLLSGDK